jgi:hypothetical protein
MKKIILLPIAALTSFLLMQACSNSPGENEKVNNSGATTVKNGKGELDSINYECEGCDKYIKNLTILQSVIDESCNKTKNSLNFSLSFIPVNVKLTVEKQDSLYYYDNNKKIENVFIITSKNGYIAKNGYGNELEGETENFFFLKDDKIVDLTNEVRLQKLKFGQYINRTLIVFADGDDFIEFTPTKDKSFIVSSNISCVNEGSLFQITLENDEEIELNSWNLFNCDANSFFEWFSDSQIEKLKKFKIKYLFFYYNGESVMCEVPKNKSDYFQQLMLLY